MAAGTYWSRNTGALVASLYASASVAALVQGAAADGSQDSFVQLPLATAAAALGSQQSGAGAVAATIATRQNRVVWLEDFGGSADYLPSAGTWTTDNAAAFSAAFSRLGTRGGVIRMLGDYYVGSSITIPEGVVLRADSHSIGAATPADVLNQGTKIWHPPTAPIILSSSSGMDGVSVVATGTTFGQTSAQVSQWTGTGIQLKANSTDHFLKDMLVLGFQWGLVPQTITTDLSVTYARFNFFGNVGFDCLNGWRFHNMSDLCRLNRPHCWPYLTVLSPAETNGAQLKRPGWGGLLTGLNDHTMVSQAFNYGYLNGFEVIDGADTTWINCDSDYPYQSATDGSFGFQSAGGAYETRWIGCQAIQRDSGFITAPTTTTSTAPLLHSQAIGCDAWENRVNSHAGTAGNSKVIGGTSRSSFAGANGAQTASACTGQDIAMHHFANLANAMVNSTAQVPQRDCGGNTYANIQTALKVTPYFPVISTSSFTPNGTDTVFQVTGGGSVATIGAAVAYTGRGIRLCAQAAFSLATTGNIKTRSGSTVSVAAGQWVSLTSDGTSWSQDL